MRDHDRLALRYTELIDKRLAGSIGMYYEKIAVCCDPSINTSASSTEQSSFTSQFMQGYYYRDLPLAAQYFKPPHKSESASSECGNGKLHVYDVWIPSRYLIMKRNKILTCQADITENFRRGTRDVARYNYTYVISEISHGVRKHPCVGPDAVLCGGIRADVEDLHVNEPLTV